jgi:hypothetical protein
VCVCVRVCDCRTAVFSVCVGARVCVQKLPFCFLTSHTVFSEAANCFLIYLFLTSHTCVCSEAVHFFIFFGITHCVCSESANLFFDLTHVCVQKLPFFFYLTRVCSEAAEAAPRRREKQREPACARAR